MRFIISYLTILCLLSYCSSIKTITTYPEAKSRLWRANRLYQQKQFSLATQENKYIIEIFPKSPLAEKALYNLGIIYISPENPAKNYSKALEYFTMLYNNYPNGSLANEAKNLIDILGILQSQEKELDRLRNTVYNNKSQILRLKKIVQEKDELIDKIEKKLEQYKEIDIELEEKKEIWGK